MKTTYKIFTILLSLVVCAGIGLYVWVQLSNNGAVRKVELSSGEETVEELSFSAENLLPGGEKEYTVLLHTESEGEFSVAFSARNVSGGTLWRYLNVEISCGDVTREAAFSDLLDGTELQFDVAIEESGTASFAVCYKMPKGTGNEAQNQTANFALRLSAKRK